MDDLTYFTHKLYNIFNPPVTNKTELPDPPKKDSK